MMADADPWGVASSSSGDDPWGVAHPTSSDTWSDVGKGAVLNAPSSAVSFGKAMAQPFIHPVDTAMALKNLGHGVLQKTGILPGTEHEKYADAVGQFFADRYGGIENVKHTLATDPVGVAADLSALLTGGGTAAARAPGIFGEVANVVSKAGRLIDPIEAAAQTVRGAGYAGSEMIGHLGTGTGGEAIRTAYRSGQEGGESAKAFQENLRGTAPMDETVDAAKKAVTNIKQQRSAAYRQGMADVGLDQKVLNFDYIDEGLRKAGGVKVFKGVDLSPKTKAVREEIADAVDMWRNRDPAEYHTAEGLDALKQIIGNIRDDTPYGSPSRVVADRAYHGIRDTIIERIPEYESVMKGYEQASKQIKEIERTLSLNPNASVDTALRKLQTVLRDNVTSAYGKRRELAEYLVKAGAPNLMERLAGQALSTVAPRGLVGKLGVEMLAMGALHVGGAGPLSLGSLATLPLLSPRLVGEGAYYAGRASPAGRPIARSIFQSGRNNNAQPFADGGAVDDDVAALDRHAELARTMTHWPEQANPAAPYLEAAKAFPSQGLQGVANSLGVQTPEWMQAAGRFMSSEPVNAALGTVMPMAAPEAAVAKAIRAYHGSPHDFEKFDISKIGTGEGAQSYGRGLYFGEAPETAEHYRAMRGTKGHGYEVDLNANPEHFLDWEIPANEQSQHVQDALKQAMGIDYYGKFDPKKAERMWKEYGRSSVNTLVRRGGIASDDEIVAQRLREAGIPGIRYLDKGSRMAPVAQQALDGVRQRIAEVERLSDSTEKADRLLRLRANEKSMVDQSKQTRNYVVFDDKMIDILKKYGMAGLAALPATGAYHFQRQDGARQGFSDGGAADDLVAQASWFKDPVARKLGMLGTDDVQKRPSNFAKRLRDVQGLVEDRRPQKAHGGRVSGELTEANKASHAEVRYTSHSSHKKQRCDLCTKFISAEKGGPACKKIQSPIAASGWCTRFVLK
jgi:hypothetical protein